MKDFNPILAIAMITVILNLGAPLDYHLIFGAGLFTVIYIVSRACGKYFGIYSASTFRGIACVYRNSSQHFKFVCTRMRKNYSRNNCCSAVINEIIAVIIAKKGFEWAGELSSEEASQE